MRPEPTPTPSGGRSTDTIESSAAPLLQPVTLTPQQEARVYHSPITGFTCAWMTLNAHQYESTRPTP